MFSNNLLFIDAIIRSHEVKANGYEVEHNSKCITVFSAPNYWYNVIIVISMYSGTPLIWAVWDQEVPVSLKLPITLKAAELNS